ncbi:hypothetical protein XarbCFBP7408_03670 [Xanthomonas arboricola pv. guizotiae]|uniref:Uncharacterized protein n=1 Tax=Xanthomonas arboricola pv. guizotiae TaxID=487867 RepID=A0A2S7A6X7_9XANT|nr:hypothetical protein XarbCFBP7409_02145 [Xanthomonas arboricola pv. guizotiae]PPU26223.1 hypothetical protein XarbCFBP7408_03670 [Xanthomonas arboricola pv. guizotiae]
MRSQASTAMRWQAVTLHQRARARGYACALLTWKLAMPHVLQPPMHAKTSRSTSAVLPARAPRGTAAARNASALADSFDTSHQMPRRLRGAA